jgi:Uma2 family endonuclease
MHDPAAAQSIAPPRFTVERYFGLVDEGVLEPEDRVELLEGVVVAMSPRNARHDAAVTRADDALRAAVGTRAVVHVQCALVLGQFSAPELDLAVVPGPLSAYDTAHPTTALLIVEVADTSLQQDRITKAAIYAAAGIPEYWIVNLHEDRVEVHRAPDRAAGVYRERGLARSGEQLELVALSGAVVAVDTLLPGR